MKNELQKEKENEKLVNNWKFETASIGAKKLHCHEKDHSQTSNFA